MFSEREMLFPPFLSLYHLLIYHFFSVYILYNKVLIELAYFYFMLINSMFLPKNIWEGNAQQNNA